MDKRVKEIIKTVILLLILIILVSFFINKVTSGETLTEYREKTVSSEVLSSSL